MSARRDGVLVTGGAGFIGQRLVRRLLEEGRSVTVLDALIESVHGPRAAPPPDLEGAHLVRGDVRDPDAWAVALEGAALVYHLAAETGTGESMYRARHYVDVNVGGAALLCDLLGALPDPPARVVLASSRAVYGEGPYRCPEHGLLHPEARRTERLEAGVWEPECPGCGRALEPLPAGADTPPRPASVYGLTKLDQEALLRTLLRPRGVEVVALRLQNVYGPGQSLRNPYTGLLSIFSVRLLAGEGVSVFEDGRESRDFVHVDDVVEAFVRAGGAPLRGPVMVADVGSGRPTAVLDAARLVGGACGAGEDRIRVTGEYRVGDVRHAFCETEALRSALGVSSTLPLERGIAELVDWVRASKRPASRLDEALAEMRAAGLLGRAAGASA